MFVPSHVGLQHQLFLPFLVRLASELSSEHRTAHDIQRLQHTLFSTFNRLAIMPFQHPIRVHPRGVRFASISPLGTPSASVPPTPSRLGLIEDHDSRLHTR